MINGVDSILAKGASASASSGNAGAGGGGGGGSIALYNQRLSLQTPASRLDIAASGGNGGNSTGNNGEGGGGGGGLIRGNFTMPAEVTVSADGGNRGTRIGYSSSASNGIIGKIVTTFNPLLNGFLFNTIRSSVSNNQLDSVCSNMKPPRILGTIPVGGSTITYEWQKSYVSSFTPFVTLTVNSDSVNYSPSLADASTPTGRVWFRRIVRDAGPPAITDISKTVEIIVHPAILNNNIGNPETFCQTGNPDTLKQVGLDLIVPTTRYLFYSWQDSTGPSLQWTNIPGFANTEDSVYLPPELNATTSYRRIVTSGSCVDTSMSVKMTILPVITGNSIKSRAPAEDSICFGMQFQELISATTLAGGDNTYRYEWESSINYSAWATASGISDRDSLDPVELLTERIPENYYQFRRIVYSGLDSVCSDISDTIHLRDFPIITNNNIYTVDQTICSGSNILISANLPNNGNNTYTWQDSTDSSTQWKDIPGFINTPELEYQSPDLTQTTSYRRIAYSSGCSDTSNSVRISVQPPITGNTIYLEKAGGSADTTICTGQTHDPLAGSVISGGIYQWFNSTVPGNLVLIPGATQVNYPNPPPSFNITTLYRRFVISGVCSDTSSTSVIINVLPPISNNVITPGQSAVCYNTLSDPISGSSVAGGSGTYFYLWEQSTDGGNSWIAADGTNTLSDYQPPVLSNNISYRRNVSSFDCLPNISVPVDIIINPLPQGPVYAGEDESIHSIDNSYYLNADPTVVAGETGVWTAPQPATAVIMNDSDSKTEVINLSSGNNLFVWTITNGLCTIDDSVYIELLPFIIPEGFSPNGDAWNNKFIIEGLNLSDQQIAELSILNGAGTVVFSTTNRDGREWIDWDGRNSNGIELPEGTYYYLLTITTNENRVFKESGFIELKRY
jgi:gliding motility-associated-like protein